jgi:hypothetical protein
MICFSECTNPIIIKMDWADLELNTLGLQTATDSPRTLKRTVQDGQGHGYTLR